MFVRVREDEEEDVPPSFDAETHALEGLRQRPRIGPARTF